MIIYPLVQAFGNNGCGRLNVHFYSILPVKHTFFLLLLLAEIIHMWISVVLLKDSYEIPFSGIFTHCS